MSAFLSFFRQNRLKTFCVCFLILLALSSVVSHKKPEVHALKPDQYQARIPVSEIQRALPAAAPELAAANSGQPATQEPQPEHQAPLAQTAEGEAAAPATITIAYYDIPATATTAEAAQPPTLVLIQKAPFASESLQPLIDELKGQARLIVPDLRSISQQGQQGQEDALAQPDSARTKALTVLALLKSLGVGSAHFVSYSQGAAVVLNIADIEPQAVKSIELISPMGIQANELLGSHVLNDGLYSLQLGTLWALTHLTPNFGYFDSKPANLDYARYLTQTDQRELEKYLRAYDGPVFIYQGKDDVLVTNATAQANYSDAQAGELYLDSGGHLNVINAPERIAPLLMGFVLRAEYQSRELVQSLRQMKFASADAPASAPLPANDMMLVGLYMVLLIVATLVSEDLTCVAAGILASKGVLGFLPAVMACIIGIFLGDLMLYALGRWLGRPALRRAPLRWFINEQDVNNSARWFHERGAMIIITSRFLPGSRMPTYLASGILRMPLGKFVGVFLLAAALWTPCIVALGYFTGDVVLTFLERYEKYAIWVLLGIIVGMMFLINTLLPLCTWKGRRILVSKWRRLTHWEYWPIWGFYPPVICYVIVKGLLKGSLTLFTSVNPAMPHSGFTDEPKAEILRGLSGAGEALPAWAFLAKNADPQERLRQLRAFMSRHELSYPIALKPNEGERGEGVAIIRSEQAALDYLSRCEPDVIAQQYIGGLEYGIFYYRYPGEEQGRIYGITDKRFTSVTGDGVHNLEHLILADKRAVASQRFFRRKWADKLGYVPQAGEKFVLAEIGTHCRGSLFLDGSHLITPELEAAIDKISKTYEGFHLGRYDMRVPSVEDLQAGRNLRIIELNGITAEPTFCYDPKHSVWNAYRVFLRQWKIALEIGARNRALGHKPSSPMQIIRLLISSRAQETFEA